MARKSRPTFSHSIRRAVLESEHSRYAIGQATGIDEGVLSKFVNGMRGLSMPTLDKLAEFLGLEVVVRSRKRGGRDG